jgi:hypothetical protein
MMKKIALAVVAFLYAVIAFAMPAEEWVIGKWRVVKIQGYAPSPDDFNERSLIGKYFVIKKDSMEFNNKRAVIKDIQVRTEDVAKNFDFWFRMNPVALKLPKEVTQIEMSFDEIGFYAAFFYISGKNSLLFEYRGVFYKAIRAK